MSYLDIISVFASTLMVVSFSIYVVVYIYRNKRK